MAALTIVKPRHYPRWPMKPPRLAMRPAGMSADPAAFKADVPESKMKPAQPPARGGLRVGPAVKNAPRGELPEFIPPELATLASRPPLGEQWLHETKSIATGPPLASPAAGSAC
jgi:hypothetical protein